MTDTSKSAGDKAADKASSAASTATKATHVGSDRPPIRDAAPGGFGGFTMIKDRVSDVVRKLTGGS